MLKFFGAAGAGVPTKTIHYEPPMEFGNQFYVSDDVLTQSGSAGTRRAYGSTSMAKLQEEAKREVGAESERIRKILVDTYKGATGFDGARLAKMWNNTFPFSALHTFEVFDGDNTTYVTTGDIGQMWLRDSSVQMMTYLPLMSKQPPTSALRQVFESVLARQTRYIHTDPYASAFFLTHGSEASGGGPNRDRCAPAPDC